MANIFAELQMAASNQNNTVSDARQKMNEILSFFWNNQTEKIMSLYSRR